MEEWKEIIGFPNHLISNYGNVKSLSYRRQGYEQIRILQTDKKGYMRVFLTNNKIRKCLQVHRLVGIHFLANPENKPTIDHIDKDRINNNVNNLRWATSVEQCETQYHPPTKIHNTKS